MGVDIAVSVKRESLLVRHEDVLTGGMGWARRPCYTRVLRSGATQPCWEGQAALVS